MTWILDQVENDKNQMKKIFEFISNHSIVLIIAGYLMVNLIFNYPIFWGELIDDSSRSGAVIGEVNASEWGMEQIYRKLLKFENPFGTLKSLFYPFGVDVSTSDILFGFHFLYLRPFLSPHQSMSFIVIFNLFMSNLIMYVFLRKLGINKITSFLVGLAYGYMTFMSMRIGHLNYSLFYVFPLFYLSILSFFSAENKNGKFIFAATSSVLLVFIMWMHAYYFIMLIISLIVLGIYHFFLDVRKAIQFIKSNLIYAFFSLSIILIVMTPWLKAFFDTAFFSETPKSAGWGGAIQYSADLLGFLVPSYYNYYYGRFISFIVDRFDITFARGIFENFSYPGIIILLGYAFLTIQLVRNKIIKATWIKIKPYFIISIVFFILLLGPFLHVAGRWAITLDDGIKLVLPLPYVFFHYIPLLSNVRSPGRFLVPFTFFAYIVVAYLLSDFLKNKSKKFLIVFTVIFLLVFLVDHRYPNQKISAPFYFPKKIYQAIASDKSNDPVLEIPFTIRDGITYFGYGDAVYQIMGQFTYDNPLISGYTGRVPDYVKNYYVKDPFIGYLGRLIDENVTINGSFDRSDLAKWQKLDDVKAKRTIDFLSIRYIILNNGELYSSTLSAQLKNLGYKKRIDDGNYSLLETTPEDEEFLNIDMGNENSNLQLGMGWNASEENSFRWAGRRTSSLFKIKDSVSYKINFTAASFYKSNKAKVYVNKRKIGEMTITPNKETYSLEVPFKLDKGINTVHFIFDNIYRPSKIITDSADQREISAMFYKISLLREKL